MDATYGWVNWLVPVFIDFILFFIVPVVIKPMSLEWVLIWVSLVIALTICTFEWIRAKFILLCFKTRRIHLIVCFAVPCKIMVVFQFMWTIIFDILCFLNPAWTGSMTLFLTVVVLGHSWVHICSSDGSNIVSYIETFVNKASCLATNGHV